MMERGGKRGKGGGDEERRRDRDLTGMAREEKEKREEKQGPEWDSERE